ncbi:putative Chloroplast-targeted copper chaperone protein [Tripterygium wilfordii]|uniref:Putative Chloroplast-targeted copper chaperone protein n=1 Tax=Tripterygium wilfordii TaxID=458696 RepID=A0A7J7DF01_TRIWF|nr:protein SODIUM POTASSIUM ROOT DEFECTIVE 2-like [Tripterygium wilfordii]KAF5744646.1 putative Chloroplast-targeted copper chaperone protein [Tripterygium wilfordii]
MKKMEIFCASPASTAVCSSLDQRSMVRHSHRHLDRSFSSKAAYTPCSSQLPISPRPSYEKMRKSNSSSNRPSDLHRKSSAGVNDLYSPPGSSRYLLRESSTTSYIDWNITSNDSDRVSALVPSQPAKPSRRVIISSNDSQALIKSSPSAPSRHQVVVLRVSIHCKGCEGKVRKHISKMEGVTSFSIDLATKKVTVIGDVTPLGVLESISRVKNAQLWPSPTPSSPSPCSVLINKNN